MTTETPATYRPPRLHHYGHPRAVFCSRACRLAFREDRRAGLIYPLAFLPTLNRFATDAEEASAILGRCPYCNTLGLPPKLRTV